MDDDAGRGRSEDLLPGLEDGNGGLAEAGGMEPSESRSHERRSAALAVVIEDEVATGNEVTVDSLVTNCSR